MVLPVYVSDSILVAANGSSKEAKMADSTNLTGDWVIDDDASLHKLRLMQLGNQVSGVYDLQQGKIDGFVEFNVVKLRWDQPGNQRGGEAQMVIEPDGKTMTGTWSYDPRVYNSGLTGSGRWTFRRDPSSPGGISVPNFWPLMSNAMTAKGWRLIGVSSFPFAAEKDGWAVGMIDAHIIDATVEFYAWDQWVERNHVASSRLFIAVFDRASQQDVEIITGLRKGNRMLPQAVAAVIHLAGCKFYWPREAKWDNVTGFSREPDFKKNIGNEIQDVLNSILGAH